jgi:molybdopterin converting factor small subunit
MFLTDGEEVAEVKGNTVGQCLEQLVARFPRLKEWLYGKDGKLNNIVDIYVNMESAYPDELTRKVKDGDEIHIITAVAGG